ncbi:NAD-binding protein, partial [Diaphorobacter nitroreducens]|uniref:NAD-binding protein n=1 Tax=Diaphorobacter nitroreducens TaxID=164759 RepID=UPI002899873C
MPSIQNPLGALPARFRRQRVLIIGCGDVGLRVVRSLNGPQGGSGRPRVLALTSSPTRVPQLRGAGVTPLLGNLDDAATLARLAGVATRVLHLAPPPGEREVGPRWWLDPRSTALARALRRRTLPQSLVYASTSGVYGDCAGAWVPESRPVAQSPYT